jgi:hypothetical protein
VAFEDSFLLFAEGFASFGLDRFQLFGRFRAAGQKTRDFLLYLISRDFFRLMTMSSSFSKRALPKAMPGDTKMPEIITLPYS